MIIAILIGTFTVSFLGTVVYCLGSYFVSRNLYSDLLKTILKRPMSFFDQTSIGSILARLLSDKDSIDSEIGAYIQTFAFGIV